MALNIARDSTQKGIQIRDMHEGQLAEIVSWDTGEGPVGELVQQFRNNFVVLGEDSYYDRDDCNSHECRVKLLEDGTMLEVTDNS